MILNRLSYMKYRIHEVYMILNYLKRYIYQLNCFIKKQILEHSEEPTLLAPAASSGDGPRVRPAA